ncbi:hypothetical protein ONS95_005800 [Cadophora gregata]|uniref:uncharacterized protein n=1 Tax=Cadophora gregata TaxID=51156 RepID=UPI0026DDA09F|nr:uncharacterized protein ONS95_005800 [Cadophora gregata]KAK0103801.1 hypothetical protein ONS95_005800 [Cadophora gregata]
MVELQTTDGTWHSSKPLRSNVLLCARCKLAGFYIAAERVDEAIEQLQTLRSDLWDSYSNSSLLPRTLAWFRMLRNTSRWFRDVWCTGHLQRYREAFQAEFLSADADQRDVEARMRGAGLPDNEIMPIRDFPMYQMAKVLAQQQQQRDIIMWDVPWKSYTLCLLKSSRKGQVRWRYLRSRYRKPLTDQDRIDELYKIYKEPAKEDT